MVHAVLLLLRLVTVNYAVTALKKEVKLATKAAAMWPITTVAAVLVWLKPAGVVSAPALLPAPQSAETVWYMVRNNATVQI
jgi:hypothetical protein